MQTDRKYSASTEDLAKLVTLFNEVAKAKAKRDADPENIAIADEHMSATREFNKWFGVFCAEAIGPAYSIHAEQQAKKNITAQLREAIGR